MVNGLTILLNIMLVVLLLLKIKPFIELVDDEYWMIIPESFLIPIKYTVDSRDLEFQGTH